MLVIDHDSIGGRNFCGQRHAVNDCCTGDRVGIKPGFYHKAQPGGFYVLYEGGFWGFYGFMWVL